jgi:uncharacterized protein (TIGR02001 family)
MKTTMWKAGVLGALSLASISMAPAAFAADDEAPAAWGGFTAGGSLTSDYRFRGISNSNREAAAQGYVQYDHASGFFGNLWFSTIDFEDEFTYDSSIEIDATVGYNHSFSEETTAGIKAVYYWYADADAPAGLPDYDYFELIASAEHTFGVDSVGPVTVSGELAWSPDFFAETGDAVALTGGVSVPIMESFLFFEDGLEASAHAGYQWLDVGEDYFFYDIGATASWGVISVDLRWVDTDLDNTDCGLPDTCEGGVVLSVSADLPG